ncbi:hypothetical protein [Nocardia fluminea]|uniref:hypothetical protein n=1 Tax=Nocardia fluminea TaxID=134984 RepID=UPI0036679EE7
MGADNGKSDELATVSAGARPCLEMRAGALYRNRLGAELRAVECVDSNSAALMLEAVSGLEITRYVNSPLSRVGVFGSVWMMATSDPCGPPLALVTPERLQMIGYQLVEEPVTELP